MYVTENASRNPKRDVKRKKIAIAEFAISHERKESCHETTEAR
jgi:hypothetical protein